jgi:iron(III) transport system ATP-binding protein
MTDAVASTRTDTSSHTGAAPTAGVTVTGLQKAFGSYPVLTGVDLVVPEGSITAILGPSGSGKTTLLRLLAGFTHPDEGTITIGGRIVDGAGRHLRPEARHVGYVPQEGSLFPHLDVEANIGFGLPRSQRRTRVGELLEMTELTELAGRYPHELSGGQQQRVALARALAPNPSLVLLDEPFSSLDATLRVAVRLEVTHILRRAGTTTVIVTHDQDEALSMADQVAVLRHGQVAQAGPPRSVYDRPVDADLARFVGEANLLQGTIRSGQAQTPLGLLALIDGPSVGVEGTPVIVLIRPEQIHIAAGQTGETTGTVTGHDYHGHDALVTIDTGPYDGTPGAAINIRCVGSDALPLGATVALRAVGPVMAWPALTNPG